jgi:type IV fimbrial biogenesis protein FimT
MTLRTSAPLRGAARGFTGIELLTVLALVAVLAALALPSLADVMANQRLRAAGSDMMSSLMAARSEAIKRRAPVRIVPVAGDDWRSGWRVATVADDEQVDRKDALGARVTVSAAPDAIVYQRNGRLSVPGATQIEFSDSEAHEGIKPRCVLIEPSGLPRITLGGCS